MTIYEARCGARIDGQRELDAHQRDCPLCQAQKRRPRRASRVESVARCGQEYPTLKSAIEHQKQCAECLEIKKRNRTELMREIHRLPQCKPAFSVTARRTSARPEIQASRAANLKRWRDENPEKFREAVAKSTLASGKRSKNECGLRALIDWPQAQVRCGTERKQVDFVSEKVWIEVDGYYHFFSPKRRPAPRKRPQRPLENVQTRDEMLNAEARRRGITLIRLAGSCFHTSTGRLRLIWEPWLMAMLRSPTPGVWCAGALYESCPWASGGCTILRSPPPPTTSSSQTE